MRLCEKWGTAAFAGVLFLTSCAGITPQQQVYALQRDYEEALVEVEAYSNLPECAPTVHTACYDQAVLDRLIDTSGHVDGLLDDAEAVVRDPAMSTTEVGAYVNVARAALIRLTTILIAEGILNAS
jgi:hypothetical protein